MIKILLIFSAISIASYLSLFIPPEAYPLTGIIGYAIPIIFLLNAFVFLFLLLNNKNIHNLIIPFFHVAIGFWYLPHTIGYNVSNENADSKRLIEVLSYNTRIFNSAERYHHHDSVELKSLVNWVVEDKSTIKCFQEFYNDNLSPLFNVQKNLIEEGYNYKYFEHKFKAYQNIRIGLAIFSKYPFVNTGLVLTSPSSNINDIIFADVLINADTIRVYNMHLQSINLESGDIKNVESINGNIDNIQNKLSSSFVIRSKQLKELISHLQSCPYPIILAGDMNDLPLSYTYLQLNRYLHNSFRDEGYGFGFTYNGVIPFLRIDHQFYRGLDLKKFKTLNNVDYTDHYPIKGWYALK
ncbi:MAG TPA: endonuclease/exonuclease/phosphatase family protein [Cyclobacteriaceae bacterium]